MTTINQRVFTLSLIALAFHAVCIGQVAESPSRFDMLSTGDLLKGTATHVIVAQGPEGTPLSASGSVLTNLLTEGMFCHNTTWIEDQSS